MWLTMTIASTLALFGIGQKWSNDNSSTPDEILPTLRRIETSVSNLNTRVTALEERNGRTDA